MNGWVLLDWIPNFSLMAKLLYEKLKEKETPFELNEEQQNTVEKLKLSVSTAPALGIPDYEKPFELFVS